MFFIMPKDTKLKDKSRKNCESFKVLNEDGDNLSFSNHIKHKLLKCKR